LPGGVALLVAVGLAAGLCYTAEASALSPASAPPEQRLAVLISTHLAHSSPAANSSPIELIPDRRPITGEPTTLPVIAPPVTRYGAQWLDVMLPGRPDGSTGWISETGTRERLTGWRITVELDARRVRVLHFGHLLRTYRAVVGKPSTPTPTGRFFVEETVVMARDEPGGPFALALSARSNALQEFEGGPGQIAIHGRNELGGTLGSAVSHGCVRLDTNSVDWLAARIGPGTPVTIYQR
jgi:lipoprotein-anchoring transpeptidase ErfK/SrfK